MSGQRLVTGPERDDTELTGTAMGTSWRLSGASSIVVMALLVTLAMFLYVGSQFVVKIERGLSESGFDRVVNAVNEERLGQQSEHKELAREMRESYQRFYEQHARINESILQLKDSMDDQNYLLTLNEAERHRLRTKMPPSRLSRIDSETRKETR